MSVSVFGIVCMLAFTGILVLQVQRDLLKNNINDTREKSIQYCTFYTNSIQGRFRFISHVTVLSSTKPR